MISLIPLVWIGMYNFPSADEYSEGLLAHQAWIQDGNIFSVIFAAISKVIEEYSTWSGIYTAKFLSAFPLSVFGKVGYVISAPLVLTVFILSVRYLFNQIMVKAIGIGKHYSDSIVCIVLFIIIQCMIPSGRVELFYWYCGAANYTITASVSFLFLGSLISLYYFESTKIWKLVLKVLGICILAFLVGGGNLLSTLNTIIVVTIVLLLFLIEHKYSSIPTAKLFLLPAIVLLIGATISIIAPGNAIRAAYSSGFSPIKAVMVSFYDYFYYCIGEWTTWPVVLMLVVLAPIFWRVLANCRYKFRFPGIVILFGYGLTSAMFTPSLFATGDFSAGRLQGMAYIMYILTLVLSEGYVIGYFRNKHRNIENCDNQYSHNELLLIMGTLIFFGFASALTIVPENHYFTYSSAITDLMNGSAQEFSKELEEREELYVSGEKDIVVKQLTVEPQLLFFSDIVGDGNGWIRDAICRYYGLNSLTVRDD